MPPIDIKVNRRMFQIETYNSKKSIKFKKIKQEQERMLQNGSPKVRI